MPWRPVTSRPRLIGVGPRPCAGGGCPSTSRCSASPTAGYCARPATWAQPLIWSHRTYLSSRRSVGQGSSVADVRPPSEETFRATLQGHTTDGEPATIIVTHQGLGRAGRV